MAAAEAHEPLPTATVVKPPPPVANALAAALFIIGIATVVGFVLAYIAAFIVVKIGLPVPRLVVGLPLIAVAALAWATTSVHDLRSGVITILSAGAIAAALIAAWDPRSPATLFTTSSKVTDVEVRGNDATIAMESKTEMTEMPPFGQTAGYALLLACFAVLATTVGHGAMAMRKRKRTSC